MASTTYNINEPRVALLVRGHLRYEDMFQEEFKDLILSLCSNLPIDIYIQTWDKIFPQAETGSVSEEKIINNLPVEITENYIKYINVKSQEKAFHDLQKREGMTSAKKDRLPFTRCSKIGWTQYWDTIQLGLDAILSSGIKYSHVISTRPDVLFERLLKTSWNTGNRPLPDVDYTDLYTSWTVGVVNVFSDEVFLCSSDLFDAPVVGCDNYIVGPVEKMLAITSWFRRKLERDDNSWVIEEADQLLSDPTVKTIRTNSDREIHQEGLLYAALRELNRD